ncbi:hypothetical protein OGAPHI_001877 [Ogataea philodendri]|uniref:Major facilitator superfamily (MFS) profile domain-containing protein n=1 Tax=Ogataea philodendri TaxID=1378263 RepID=A0A9P8P9C4_9ASCO|nr:uncharacterized protein OGAPHI_001877 [Ogataea philodendri]KAH3668123.1 hypothetical protein OGAPHI_001877 [Ogataea philodendri]
MHGPGTPTERSQLLPPAPVSSTEVALPANLAIIIISLWTGSFLSAADTTIVSTTANTIASLLHDSNGIAWIGTSYLLTNAVFQPLTGKMSELFGRRSTLLFAQFWFGLGCLLCACSKSVTQFTMARALAGIGGGGISALSSIIVTDVVPLRMRGIFQGYANLMYGLGQFVGPVLGGLCLGVDGKNGWRWMFGLQVPLVVIAALLVSRNIHEYTTDAEERLKNRFSKKNFLKIDIGGSITLSLLITSVLLLFTASSSTQAVVYIVAALSFGLLFYVVETRLATDHIIPPFAFKGVLRLGAFTAMFGSMTMYGTNFILPIYLQTVHGLDSVQLGLFNGFGVFFVSFGSLFAGWLLKHNADVKDEDIVAKAVRTSILGFLAVFSGSFICLSICLTAKPAFAPEDRVLWKIALLAGSYSLSGLGYGMFLVSLLIMVVGIVGAKHQAPVTGMNYLFRSIGSVSGAGITLNIYKTVLSTELWHYFIKKKRPDGEKIYQSLMDNFFYVRNGLDPKYTTKVLKIYREAVSDSVTMVFIFAAMALTASISLRLYRR